MAPRAQLSATMVLIELDKGMTKVVRDHIVEGKQPHIRMGYGQRVLSCLVLLILLPRCAPRGAFFNPRTFADYRCLIRIKNIIKTTFPIFQIPHTLSMRHRPNQHARRRATRAISISRARRRAHPSPVTSCQPTSVAGRFRQFE